MFDFDIQARVLDVTIYGLLGVALVLAGLWGLVCLWRRQ
jgi:hypothetical protein